RDPLERAPGETPEDRHAGEGVRPLLQRHRLILRCPSADHRDMALAGVEARIVEETVRRYFARGASADAVTMTVGPLRDALSLLRELPPQGRRTAFELRRLQTTALRD